MAEIALLKISKLASDYGLSLEFVAPQAIMDVLLKNQKISRFGVRELERIIFDLFASDLAKIKREGAKKARIDVSPDGKFVINRV